MAEAEESGENWPSNRSDSNTEGSDDDVNDFCFEDEFTSGDDESEKTYTGDPITDREERKREFDESLLALSATIPGLKIQKNKKKMDNTLILEKASKYVKQLQERVRALEQEVESNNIPSSSSTAASCEEVMNSEYYSTDETLPQVRARVLGKEALVIIQCEKQKAVMLKILSHLQSHHLSVVNNSVLHFGKSTLDITILAQMRDEYNMTVDELVTTLKVAILA